MFWALGVLPWALTCYWPCMWAENMVIVGLGADWPIIASVYFCLAFAFLQIVKNKIKIKPLGINFSQSCRKKPHSAQNSEVPQRTPSAWSSDGQLP